MKKSLRLLIILGILLATFYPTLSHAQSSNGSQTIKTEVSDSNNPGESTVVVTICQNNELPITCALRHKEAVDNVRDN